jgi:hypothetical protein
VLSVAGVSTGVQGNTLQAAHPRSMELQIHQVTAKDECGRGIEEWSYDRMTLGAVTVQGGKTAVRTNGFGEIRSRCSTHNYPHGAWLSYRVKPGAAQRFQAISSSRNAMPAAALATT